MTKNQQDCRSFINAVVAMYTALPDTPARARPLDRRLAETWHCRQLSLQTIESAFLLGQLRRLGRPLDYPKLQPIRSMYYFVPLLEEVLQQPLAADFVEYAKMKILAIQNRRPESQKNNCVGTGL
jgi:hypothetical protein